MTKSLVFGELAGIKLGDGYPVRVMGIINASPESFYRGSENHARRHF